MRFVVDENLPFGVAELLVGAGHDVIDVATSPHRSSSDAALWQLAIDEDRVLVTRDRDFPLPGTAGRPPGIVLVRPASDMRTAAIVALVQSALDTVEVGAFTDHVTVIEPGRVRQRPYASLPR